MYVLWDSTHITQKQYIIFQFHILHHIFTPSYTITPWQAFSERQTWQQQHKSPKLWFKPILTQLQMQIRKLDWITHSNQGKNTSTCLTNRWTYVLLPADRLAGWTESCIWIKAKQATNLNTCSTGKHVLTTQILGKCHSSSVGGAYFPLTV